MTQKETPTGESFQASAFNVAGLMFGIPVRDVQEVIRFQEMTPVPLAPSSVRGLINLRGQIITAIDMRTRLGLPPRTDGTPPMNVIVRGPEGGISLLVDQIGDVVEVLSDQYEAPPDTLEGECGKAVKGVYKLAGKLLLILDKDKIISDVL